MRKFLMFSCNNGRVYYSTSMKSFKYFAKGRKDINNAIYNGIVILSPKNLKRVDNGVYSSYLKEVQK